MQTSEQVWEVLRKLGETPVTLQGLLNLYKTDRECFFALACVGVNDKASEWAWELANLAARLRSIVLGGFDIVSSGEGWVITGESESIPFEKIGPDEVRSFLNELKGISSTSSTEGKDFVGTVVSEEEVLFKLGNRENWE